MHCGSHMFFFLKTKKEKSTSRFLLLRIRKFRLNSSPPIPCSESPMEDSPINRLPQDTLHQIFSSLPLRQIMICRSICKSLNQILSSPSFIHLISSTQPPLKLLVLRPPHHHRSRPISSQSSLHVYDPDQNLWLRFNLDFLPFRSLQPVASSLGLIYFWAESRESTETNKSLIISNSLTRQFKILPQLGSAWWRHGSVLVDSVNRVTVLSELATLCFLHSRCLRFDPDLEPDRVRVRGLGMMNWGNNGGVGRGCC